MSYMSQLDALIAGARARGVRFVAVPTHEGWRIWDVRRERFESDAPATSEAEADADAEWLNSPEPLDEPDITPIGED